MKVIIIGSGMAGLTSGAYLSEAGHEVKVYEQFGEIGGVTATYKQDSFSWDLGPLLLEGFLPGEPANRILRELQVDNKVKTNRYDRGLAFPDFSLWKEDQYGGPYWRKKKLESLFPHESEGLDRYYDFYDHFTRLLRYDSRLFDTNGLKSLVLKARMWLGYRKLRHLEDWTAKQLMDHFFEGPELKGLFTAILADLVVTPSQFPALGVPMLNFETAFDTRIPLSDKYGSVTGYSYILGGCQELVKAVSSVITRNKGEVKASTPIKKIKIDQGRAAGVIFDNNEFEQADLVVCSGGAKEAFNELVGAEYFNDDFMQNVNSLVPMQSVFMVHLGVDFDPLQYQQAALCYYYGTYDIEKGVRECQEGKYHEGRDGFLIYAPSAHSKSMAKENHHAVTVYTIAPNFLDNSSWAEKREELADKLIEEAERFVPGLRQGTLTRAIMTPEDFRARTHQLTHHSFGGLAPVMGQNGPKFQTPAKDFWFIGSQSESGGGVKGVMVGAKNAAQQILDQNRGR